MCCYHIDPYEQLITECGSSDHLQHVLPCPAVFEALAHSGLSISVSALLVEISLMIGQAMTLLQYGHSQTNCTLPVACKPNLRPEFLFIFHNPTYCAVLLTNIQNQVRAPGNVFLLWHECQKYTHLDPVYSLHKVPDRPMLSQS
jgi:hypothetical protein